jgi:hypothetical protein
MKYTKKRSKRLNKRKVGGLFWSKKKVYNPADIFFQSLGENPKLQTEHLNKIQQLKKLIKSLHSCYCLEPTKYFDIISNEAYKIMMTLKDEKDEKDVIKFLFMDIEKVLEYIYQFEKCEKKRNKHLWKKIWKSN